MLSGLTINSSTVIKIPAAAVLSPALTGLNYLLKRQVCGWSHPKTDCAGFEQGRPPDSLGRLAGANIDEK